MRYYHDWQEKNKICHRIDPSCPSYSCFEKNKEERCTNSSNLKFEVNWTWKIKKVEVIPVIIGALGTVSKDFSTWIEKINFDLTVEMLLKNHVYLEWPGYYRKYWMGTYRKFTLERPLDVVHYCGEDERWNNNNIKLLIMIIFIIMMIIITLIMIIIYRILIIYRIY